MINLPKRSTGTDANVPLRGVEKAAMPVRGDIKIVEGRTFELGRNEVIVGAGAARAFAGLDVGKKIRVGQNEWEVVGIFTAAAARRNRRSGPMPPCSSPPISAAIPFNRSMRSSPRRRRFRSSRTR